MPSNVEEIKSPPLALHSDARVSPPRFYRPELDVLRFMAFFMVLLAHTMPGKMPLYEMWSASPLVRLTLDRIRATSAFGLPLFFCLSAYLIASLLLRERDYTGTISLKGFYIRRVLRIWPLYLVALIAGFIPGYADHAQRNAAFLSFLFLAGNWYCGIYDFPLNPIAPLWSISVEEQFYLFIPLLAKRGGRRTLGIVAAVLFALLPVSLGVLVYRHAPDYAVWTNSFVQFSSFATGLALAIWLHWRSHQISSRRSQVLIGLAGCALLGGASLAKPAEGPAVNWLLLVVGYSAISLGAAICIYAFIAQPWRPPFVLVYLGKISYGLYVVHPWAVGIAKIVTSELFPAAAAGSILYTANIVFFSFLVAVLMASLSYYVLESPFLRLKDRFALVHSRPVS
jgi:peptidoglycan/LPS O-acetylase OafA/YrhL